MSRPACEAGTSDGAEGGGEPAPDPSCSGDPAAATKDDDRWRKVSRLVIDVAGRVPILGSLQWEPSVKERFLAQKGKELPRVEYPDRKAEFAAAEEHARAAARDHLGDSPADAWVRETLESYAQGARMLQAVGTPAFGPLAAALYGRAGEPLTDRPGSTTDLELAQAVLQAPRVEAGPIEEPMGARAAAREVLRRLREELPGEKLRVTVSRGVAAKAIAGTRGIRLRKGASFTRREVEVLVAHEGLVHFATTLNGARQPVLRCLGRASPRTLRLQEGLAVFAEYMCGAFDQERLRRIAERVVAIDLAQRGGSFLDVHGFFLERGQPLDEAYESARRVFRGAPVEGGAAFAKDLVYLQGLARLQVHLAEQGSGDIEHLFTGKLGLEDLPALAELRSAGVVTAPKHVPAWARQGELLRARLAKGGPLQLEVAPARRVRGARVG